MCRNRASIEKVLFFCFDVRKNDGCLPLRVPLGSHCSATGSNPGPTGVQLGSKRGRTELFRTLACSLLFCLKNIQKIIRILKVCILVASLAVFASNCQLFGRYPPEAKTVWYLICFYISFSSDSVWRRNVLVQSPTRLV